MCLGTIYTEQALKRLLRGKAEFFTAYKVVKVLADSRSSYRAEFNTYHFEQGLNKAVISRKIKRGNKFYFSGFHLFLTKKSAKRWAGLSQKILHCRVPKSAVTTYGQQDLGPGLKTIVCKYIIMPERGTHIVSDKVFRQAKKDYAKLN